MLNVLQNWKKLKEKFCCKNVWSNDGRIIYKDNGDDKPKYILIDIVALFYGERN